MKRQRDDADSSAADSDEYFSDDSEPAVKKHHAGNPQGDVKLTDKRHFTTKSLIHKDKVFRKLGTDTRYELSWMQDDMQMKLLYFVKEAIHSEGSRCTVHTALVEEHRSQALMHNIVRSLSVGEDFKPTKNTGIQCAKGRTLFQQLLFVEENDDDQDVESTMVLRGRDHIRRYVDLLEKEEVQGIKTFVLLIPISFESDKKLHTTLRKSLQTLNSKVVIFYLLRDKGIMNAVLQEQLDRESTLSQLKIFRMKWHPYKASCTAKAAIKQLNVPSAFVEDFIVVPPLTPFYLYLYLRQEWQRTVTCHPRYEKVIVRFCETALQASSVSLVTLQARIKEINIDAHGVIFRNLDYYQEEDHTHSEVAFQLSEDHSLIMTINGRVCPQNMFPWSLTVTPEVESRIEEEMKFIQGNANNVQLEQHPPGSMALHTSAMLPFFQEPEKAQQSLMSSVRDFCFEASPGAVVLYENQMLIDPQSNRQRNVFSNALCTQSNVFYAMAVTIKDMMHHQENLQRQVDALKDDVAFLKEQKKPCSKRSGGVGIIYKDTKFDSLRIQFKKQDGKWANKCISIFKDRAHTRRRPIREIYQKAIEVGLTHETIIAQINKLVETGVLVKETN